MKNIGRNIKSIRQAKGMTQDGLAEALFVTRQTISNYENGRSHPDLQMLLKIAEILEVDIHTVIYGIPVSQNKKNAYKWLAGFGGVLLVVAALYITLSILFSTENAVNFSQHSLRFLNRMTLRPVTMFLLGWVLVHCLSVFTELQQLRAEKFKPLRIILWVLLGLLIVIPVPYLVFDVVGIYRSMVYHNVSMSFPYIPVLQESFMVIMRLVHNAPFVYIILGGAFWLLALPNIQKQHQ